MLDRIIDIVTLALMAFVGIWFLSQNKDDRPIQGPEEWDGKTYEFSSPNSLLGGIISGGELGIKVITPENSPWKLDYFGR